MIPPEACIGGVLGCSLSQAIITQTSSIACMQYVRVEQAVPIGVACADASTRIDITLRDGSRVEENSASLTLDDEKPEK